MKYEVDRNYDRFIRLRIFDDSGNRLFDGNVFAPLSLQAYQSLCSAFYSYVVDHYDELMEVWKEYNLKESL